MTAALCPRYNGEIGDIVVGRITEVKPCVCAGGGGWSWLSPTLSASRDPKTLTRISVPVQGIGNVWIFTGMRLEEASRAVPSCAVQFLIVYP